MTRRERFPLLTAGAAAAAVVCCAGLPLLAGAAAGIGATAAIGVGAGALVALVAVLFAIVRARRRRCAVDIQREGLKQ
jgi:hypothetical protein